jgi:hypothetical protein
MEDPHDDLALVRHHLKKLGQFRFPYGRESHPSGNPTAKQVSRRRSVEGGVAVLGLLERKNSPFLPPKEMLIFALKTPLLGRPGTAGL